MYRVTVYVLAVRLGMFTYQKTAVKHGNASVTICHRFIQFDLAEYHAYR
jgi:hypothetical protein